MAIGISELISGKDAERGGSSDQPRRLLAQESRAEFDAWKMDRRWTAEECYNVITYMWLDEELKSNWRLSVLEHDLAGELNDPTFRIEFLDVTSNQLGLLLATFDDLTRNAWMRVRPQTLTYNSIMYKHLSPSYWMDPFQGSGNFAVIYGDPGSGKTDFSVSLMSHSLDVGHYVVTNIKVPPENRPKNLSYHSSFRKILLKCIDNLLVGHITDFYLDELKGNMNRAQAGKKSYINAELVTTIIRKLGANFIGVIQDPKDTPTIISTFKQISYTKMSKQVVTVKTDRSLNTVIGVQKATIPYDTGDIASLVIDVDMGAMNDYLGALPEDTNKLTAARAYLGDAGEKPSQIEVEIAAKTLYLIGNTQEEVAKILGYSQRGISKMLERHGVATSHRENSI